MPDTQQTTEPYGAQALRWLHYQAGQQVVNYDQLLKNLDDGPTRELVEDIIRDRVALMDRLERHWREHPVYQDLPELEGSSDFDEDGDPGMNEADSGQDEEPTPDEALQGMRANETGRADGMESEDDIEPGEMGEKSLDTLLADAQRQQAQIERINEAAQQLLQRLA